MSFFKNLFKRREKDNRIEQHVRSAELLKLIDTDAQLKQLLKGDHYVARSEYLGMIRENEKLASWFNVLKESNTFEDFCRKNNISIIEVNSILAKIDGIKELVDSQNEMFITRELGEKKDYFDHILRDSDPNILLDDDQRRAVLTDEDYCLIIAGAGAGKTTTVAAKVKYLVDKQDVDPKQILVISFTNKAVNELKQRIIGDLKIECPIATFHSAGNAVIHKQNPEKLNIVTESTLYMVVQNYFRGTILKNESAVNNLILFFGTYFDAPYEGEELNDFFNNIAKQTFTTMRSELDDFRQQVVDRRTKKAVTIQNEILRSHQEVEIANFLYLNGIEYEYEPIYKYDILFSRKPYTPDFRIWQDGKEAYLEHFGITEDGRNNLYSTDEIESYKKAINDKIKLHKQHGTNLIYTFSGYRDGRRLLDHLRTNLLAAGLELRPRPNEEVMEKIITSEENRYIRKLVTLITRFITNFKTNGYTTEDFSRMYKSTNNVRTQLFLSICNDCYLEYERYLKENKAVDFQDMINESARILHETKEMKEKLDFKYIIVDEYQDISRQRFDLVTALREVTNAKIVAVGDDWQSIYAFSGSDISLFTKFAEKMGYAKPLKIVRTYRNSQEVIDIAGNFIQKNTEQIQKSLLSNKHIKDPVIIFTYDSKLKKQGDRTRSGVNYAIAHATEVALGHIMEYNRAEGKPDNSSILLIGRFGFDGDRLERSGLFEYTRRGSQLRSVKYPELNITFMTAHSSKGLGFDNVIVVNGRNETYGFPSKIENDPVLKFVVKEDLAIEYAEERRLFYVAMTRTKNRVFFIAPESNPSEFLIELKHDYKNVVLKGAWNEEDVVNANRKACPMCGYSMQYRYKNSYGLRLYICTNEPEVCGFMTNRYGAGKLSILKCDSCRDGYLIVKTRKGEEEFFLGCTNYKSDGTGCSRTMSAKSFYDSMGIEMKTIAKPVIVNKGRNIPPQISENPGPETVDEEPKPKPPAIIEAPDYAPVLYKGEDLNVVVATILQTLAEVSERKFYGATILKDILKGSENKKIIKDKLNTLDGYGKLISVHRDDIWFIIEWLIDKEFIRQTKGPYPVLHPTYNSNHYNETMSRQRLQSLKRLLQANNENDNQTNTIDILRF